MALTRDPAHSRPGVATPPRRRLLTAAPTVVIAVSAVACLTVTGTPLAATLAYIAYAALAVVLPGTLVYRGLIGFRGSLLEDLAWGSVVGLVIELVGWAVLTATGLNPYLWVWPGTVLVAFAAVPRLRRYWRQPPRAGSTPWAAAWGVALASVLSFVSLSVLFYQGNPIPPSGVTYNVDLPWHLGVAHELQRTVVPQTPEALAEGTLHYHWFSNAHFASANLISGVDLPTILTRTGLFLLVVVVAASTAALAMHLTRRGWVAGVAAVLVVSTTSGAPFWWVGHAVRIVYPDSPSGIYAVGTSCLIAALLVDLARRDRITRAGWSLLVVLLVMAIGSKPSVLIVLLPGVGLLWLVQAVTRRRPNVGLLVAGVLMTAAVVVSLPLFSSWGGSALRPNVDTTIVLPATPVVGLVVLALVKSYLLFFTSGLTLLRAGLRRDPGALLLACAVLAGFLEAWLISHPGLSQRFFWSTAMPFAAVLTAWGVVDTWPRDVRARRRLWAFAGAAGAVFAVALVVPRLDYDARAIIGPGFISLGVSVLVVAALAARLRVKRSAALAVAVVLPVALTIPTGLGLAWSPKPAVTERDRLAESRAAIWIDANLPVDAVVATNSHCIKPIPLDRTCDARSFWVAGFGGRRVLLEGYGVSPRQLELTGVRGLPAWRQPYHDQALYELNERVFTDPDVADLDRLRVERGVTHLVATRRAGPVSDHLAELAELVYANDVVSVYRIRPAG